jgi:threo-3-hydroxy-L-aspartate ammonia-lyase
VVLELRDVEAAAERLRGIAAKTPVLTSRTLDARTGAHVFVKAECFQRGGAFKFRGAYNKISQVAESCRGIAAFSSGNHAQAVALASAAVGLPATILMPADAPRRRWRRPAGTARRS